MQTIAEKLGAYASTLRYEDIPADVIHQAKRTITDTLGCAYGGYEGDTARIARDLAGLVTSKQPATILCSGQKTSADLAVFANDAMIRYLDFNDGYISNGGGHVGFIVASELPRERETILVRIMAGGAALSAALADLAALPAGAYERDVASRDVLELRQVLGQKSKKTKEEEAFIVSTQDIVDQLRDEGRREGRDEGRREGRAEEAARNLLTVLRARGIAVPDPARERILAEKDPARLERWIEKAVVAASLAELLDEPS